MALSAVASLSEWADSVGQRLGRGDDPADDEQGAERREERPSSLFRCPDCDAVYVAAEKATCRSCDAAVEPIQSTLTDSR